MELVQNEEEGANTTENNDNNHVNVNDFSEGTDTKDD